MCGTDSNNHPVGQGLQKSKATFKEYVALETVEEKDAFWVNYVNTVCVMPEQRKEIRVAEQMLSHAPVFRLIPKKDGQSARDAFFSDEASYDVTQ